MAGIKKKGAKKEQLNGEQWFANKRYRNFLPPEKTYFPRKLALAKKSVANIQWMD